jgi:hypothetical protein
VKKLTILVATALMLAMMVAFAGTASAAPVGPLNGASHANSNASQGIGTALFHFGTHGP